MLDGADIFLGLSAPRVLKPEWLPRLAERPLILALANPDPEILPELVRDARPDAIVATGRTDYPNQVNNVLCFPFIFRGALDVGATEINEAMKIAAVEATAELARVEASDVVATAYGGAAPVFGPTYIIPKPFDPRLILQIAPAVARAAMASGVATRPIEDFDAYRRDLERYVFRSGQLMRPIVEAVKKDIQRIVYAEGADERVLRAVQTLVDDGLARPILIGDRDEIAAKVRDLGLRLNLGDAVQVLDPARDRDVFDPLVASYQSLVGRRGVPPDAAARRMIRRSTVAAAMLLHAGQADAAVCGGTGDWWRHMTYLMPIIPKRPEVSRIYALSALILDTGNLFMCDTHVNLDPTAEESGRDDRPGRRRGAPIRPGAEGRAAVAFQLRQQQYRDRAQDAPGAGDAAQPRPGARGGWRDAPRCRPAAEPAGTAGRRFEAGRRRQPAGDAEPGCGQHRLHPAEGRRRRAAGRPRAAGHEPADPRGGADHDRARDRQRQRGGGPAGAAPPRDVIALALGLGVVGLLWLTAGAFGRASVSNVKSMLAWLVALAGLSMAAMLFLTGRGALAMSGLVLLGPLAWSYWQESRGRRTRPSAPLGRMARKEALEVLGLTEGASDSDVRAAYVRLMRTAHPDGGGTDWLAARVNQARDVLLRR